MREALTFVDGYVDGKKEVIARVLSFAQDLGAQGYEQIARDLEYLALEAAKCVEHPALKEHWDWGSDDLPEMF